MPTVAEILKEHVALDVECFDRLYLNGYIPSLQTEGQLTYFLTQHLGNKIASPALLGRITNDFVKRVESFIGDQGIPRVEFKNKDRKDCIANDLRGKDPRRDVVVFVGVAQEKQQAFKGKKDRDPKSRYVNFSYSRQSVFVKQYYFYIDDADFGPCFIKIGAYAPFPDTDTRSLSGNASSPARRYSTVRCVAGNSLNALSVRTLTLVALIVSNFCLTVRSSRAPPAVFDRASSPAGSRQVCTWNTSPPISSSTSRRTVPPARMHDQQPKGLRRQQTPEKPPLSETDCP